MEGLELAAVSEKAVAELENEIEGLEKMLQDKDRRICQLEHLHEKIAKEQTLFKSQEVFKREIDKEREQNRQRVK